MDLLNHNLVIQKAQKQLWARDIRPSETKIYNIGIFGIPGYDFSEDGRGKCVMEPILSKSICMPSAEIMRPKNFNSMQPLLHFLKWKL
jgi:hypothetical protein